MPQQSASATGHQQHWFGHRRCNGCRHSPGAGTCSVSVTEVAVLLLHGTRLTTTVHLQQCPRLLCCCWLLIATACHSKSQCCLQGRTSGGALYSANHCDHMQLHTATMHTNKGLCCNAMHAFGVGNLLSAVAPLIHCRHRVQPTCMARW
jgi:hypothetical protein